LAAMHPDQIAPADADSHFAVIGSGPLSSTSALIPFIQRHPHVIAVDGGLNHLHQMKVAPELIIGDFDSLNKELLAKYTSVEQKKFPCDKDASDMQLGIEEAFKRGARKVTLYGALGGRTDHLLGNLMLLRIRPGAVFIESEQEVLFAVEGSTTLALKPGQTISFFALGEKAEKVTTKGFKWDVTNATINSDFFSLSNVAILPEVSLSVGSGILVVNVQKTLP